MLFHRRRSLALGSLVVNSASSLQRYPSLASPSPHQYALLDAGPPVQHLPRHRPTPRLGSRRATKSEHGSSSSTKEQSHRQAAKKTERKKKRRTRTMPPTINTGSAQQPKATLFTFPTLKTSKVQFTFQVPPPSSMAALSFPPRPSLPRDRNKRSRPLNDIDGEHSSLRKKKRRLRRVLVTSRLSKPYSYPATNIVDRGSSKIAVWAKQKAVGRNILRKAAILNYIHKDLKAREIRQGGWERWEMAKLAFLYGSLDPHLRPGIREALKEDSQATETSSQNPQENIEAIKEVPTYRSPNEAYSYAPTQAHIPRRTHLPLPPSPLGLSNYDAFDLEDDIPNRYADLDDEDQTQDEDICESFPQLSPISTSTSFGSTLSTAETESTKTARTPPQTIYSDFNILDPGLPVVGDYDAVDGADGLDTVWPGVSSLVPEAIQKPTAPLPSLPTPAVAPSTWTTSPNFYTCDFPTRQISGTTSRSPNSANQLSNDLPSNTTEDERKTAKNPQKNFTFLQFNS